MKLRFICKHGERHDHVSDGVFETCNWIGHEDTATEGVGGRVYPHEKQDAAAWHGGTIIDWRFAPEKPERKKFKYRVDGPFRVHFNHPQHLRSLHSEHTGGRGAMHQYLAAVISESNRVGIGWGSE